MNINLTLVLQSIMLMLLFGTVLVAVLFGLSLLFKQNQGSADDRIKNIRIRMAKERLINRTSSDADPNELKPRNIIE